MRWVAVIRGMQFLLPEELATREEADQFLRDPTLVLPFLKQHTGDVDDLGESYVLRPFDQCEHDS